MVEAHLVVLGEGHHPPAAFLVADRLGVAEVAHSGVGQYRVGAVRGERTAAVGGVVQVLRLVARTVVRRHRGQDDDRARSKARRVVGVDHRRARPDVTVGGGVLGYGDPPVREGDQVGAGGQAPGGADLAGEVVGVVEVVVVVRAVDPDRALRVVLPLFGDGEVIRGAVARVCRPGPGHGRARRGGQYRAGRAHGRTGEQRSPADPAHHTRSSRRKRRLMGPGLSDLTR